MRHLTGDILLNGVTQKEVRDYKIEMPVVTFGKLSEYESSSPGVFVYPSGLTIDPTSDYIYICDQGNDRVQVFNKPFEFLFLFSDKMSESSGICIKHNKVYVTQYASDLLTVYSTKGSI